MIASLIFGALVGYGLRLVEPHVARLLPQLLRMRIEMSAADMRVVTVVLALCLVALLTALVGGDSSVLMAALGLGFGHFGQQIVGFMRDPDGAMGDPADDWDGSAAGPRRRVGNAARQQPATDPDAETLRAVSDELRSGGSER